MTCDDCSSDHPLSAPPSDLERHAVPVEYHDVQRLAQQARQLIEALGLPSTQHKAARSLASRMAYDWFEGVRDSSDRAFPILVRPAETADQLVWVQGGPDTVSLQLQIPPDSGVVLADLRYSTDGEGRAKIDLVVRSTVGEWTVDYTHHILWQLITSALTGAMPTEMVAPPPQVTSAS